MLERIDRIDADITRLSAVIERLLAPHEEPLQQAESMPGWGRRAARDVLAETGADMTRLPTPAHLASWAGSRWTASPASAPGAPTASTATGISARSPARPPPRPARPRPVRKHHVGKLASLGYEVTLTRPQPDAPGEGDQAA
jgi:transposase IS116/IS110/IS902 family protein